MVVLDVGANDGKMQVDVEGASELSTLESTERVEIFGMATPKPRGNVPKPVVF